MSVVNPIREMMTCELGMECVSCGDNRKPNTTCSHCGGYGLVNSGEDITDCYACGYSGVEFPPTCLGCGKYRKWIPMEHRR